MRIVFITQDDPFYLGESFQYLLSNMPKGTEVVGGVVLKVSPFGKQRSLMGQAAHTFEVFGFRFLIHYGLKYMSARLGFSKSVPNVLRSFEVPLIELKRSINDSSSLDAIRALDPDLIISIAGNQIFKQPLIDLAPEGCLNLHTALLPKYRGLMPTFWVLANGEAETGVSVFFVDEEVDNGPILVQRRIAVDSSTQAELIQRTKAVGMECIIEAIELIQRGEYEVIPNPKDHATYYSEPTRSDVERFLAIGNRFF